MIGIDVLIADVPGLTNADIERWIQNQWVRPTRQAGRPLFRDIDVARVRLIQELRVELEVDERALPVVLSLLDQLYDTRRRMREVAAAIESAPEETRAKIVQQLKQGPLF